MYRARGGGAGSTPDCNQNSFFYEEKKLQNVLKRKNMHVEEQFWACSRFMYLCKLKSSTEERTYIWGTVERISYFFMYFFLLKSYVLDHTGSFNMHF